MSTGGDPALIGRTIAGKYVIQAYLGGGAMGAVYRARQPALDRNVALKVMHGAVASDPTFVARFHREAKAASRLDHPNSMRVIDFGEEPDGLLYIAMEYLEGRDLYRVMHEDWPLTDARIADILRQALAALAVAHDMGVIHRDLKPENIMVLRGKDDEGREADLVKVCDFGIAKLVDPGTAATAQRSLSAQKLTTQGIVIGTPEYMSPEQARGEPLDTRSDIYQIGVILYQLLTGQLPFTGESPLGIVLKHVGEDPAPPRAHYPEVHAGLEAVCMRALSKAPADRFPSAREMRAALRAAIDGRNAPLAVSPPAVRAAAPVPTPDSRPPAADARASAPDSRSVPTVPVATLAPAVASAFPPDGANVVRAGLERRRGRGVRAVVAIGLVVALGAIGLRFATSTGRAHHLLEAPRATRSAAHGAVYVAHARKLPAADEEAPSASTSAAAASASVAPPPSPASASPRAASSLKCAATLGAPRATSTGAAELVIAPETAAAWNACTSHTRSRVATTAVMHLSFAADGHLKTASCVGCSAPGLAACMANGATQQKVNGAAESGDDATFDVPVTFVCD